MTIAITVGTVTAENAHVTSPRRRPMRIISADVVVAADIAGKTEMEIVALLQTKYGDEMDEIARKGDYEGDFAVEAGKEYTAVAFAYDAATSELTTKLASETYSAPLVDGNSIFTMTSPTPPNNIGYTITSSDPDMYYMPRHLRPNCFLSLMPTRRFLSFFNRLINLSVSTDSRWSQSSCSIRVPVPGPSPTLIPKPNTSF